MSTVNDDLAKAVLAQNLRDLLATKKWSGRELARQTGDPVMTIHNAITGKNLPRAGVLVRIADVLGVQLDELFEVRKKTSQPA